jgi:predicted anti-sigma-YlaC factor YlaD
MSSRESDGKTENTGGYAAMKCEDIQSVLLPYFSRELGRARAALIREHIRKCDSCRTAAVDMQATLALLRAASRAEKTQPTHLSESRRKRIIRAITHPVLDWLIVHHILVSVLIAAAVLVWLFVWMRDATRQEEEDMGYPVQIIHQEQLPPTPDREPPREKTQ